MAAIIYYQQQIMNRQKSNTDYNDEEGAFFCIILGVIMFVVGVAIIFSPVSLFAIGAFIVGGFFVFLGYSGYKDVQRKKIEKVEKMKNEVKNQTLYITQYPYDEEDDVDEY